jgi:hypothetical protein
VKAGIPITLHPLALTTKHKVYVLSASVCAGGCFISIGFYAGNTPQLYPQKTKKRKRKGLFGTFGITRWGIS